MFVTVNEHCGFKQSAHNPLEIVRTSYYLQNITV